MSKTLAEAARELRELSGENQQFFGAALRISTRAVQQYENGDRTPEPRQLVSYASYAVVARRPDLYKLFADELMRQLAPPKMHGTEFSAKILRAGDIGFFTERTSSDVARDDADATPKKGGKK